MISESGGGAKVVSVEKKAASSFAALSSGGVSHLVFSLFRGGGNGDGLSWGKMEDRVASWAPGMTSLGRVSCCPNEWRRSAWGTMSRPPKSAGMAMVDDVEPSSRLGWARFSCPMT